MRFFNKLSESTIRLIFFLITIYCSIFSGIPLYRALISYPLTIDGSTKDFTTIDKNKGLKIVVVPENSEAKAAGLQNDDIILAVNGSKINSIQQYQNILSDNNNNNPVTYTIKRGNVLMDVNVNVHRYFHILYFVFALLGFGFLLNGFLVGYSGAKDTTAQMFFLMSAAASMGFPSYGGVWYYTGLDNIFYYNFTFSSAFFYPLIFHFFTLYPSKYEFRNRRLTISIVYIYELILFTVLSYINADDISNFSYIIIQFFSYSPFLFLVSGIYLFVKSYKKIKDIKLKKSLRVITYGFLFGGIGFIYYFFILSFIIKSNITGMNFLWRIPTILILSIPISFGYSIFKYKILDTEVIVKKSIIFFILAIFISSIYLISIYFIDSLIINFGGNKSIVSLAAIVIIIFAFDYVNKWAKMFVDRNFFKKRYNYRKSLLNFSEELPYINNIKDVIEKVNKSITETMGVDEVKFWIYDKSFVALLQNFYIFKDGKKDKEFKLRDDIFSFIHSVNAEPKFLYAVNLNELNLTENYKDFLRNENIVLSIPIYIKNRLIGAINFGEKPTKKRYSEEDIDLLKTITSQTSIAFENSRLKLEEANKQKIEEELIIAKRIQNSLLPKKNLLFNNIEFCGLTVPAKEIGGDFFDYIKIDDNRLLAIVADVSGKGIPASLYMAKVQAMTRFATKIFKSPKDILIEVNKQIYKKLERNYFVTMALALFDVERKKVFIARAGHNPILHSRNGDVHEIKSKGIGLGLDNEFIFNENIEEIELEFQNNNLFVLYTDGLNEAMNNNRDEFGTDSVIENIKKSRNETPQNIQSSLMSEVLKFRNNAEQNDDITLVIIKTN